MAFLNRPKSVTVGWPCIEYSGLHASIFSFKHPQQSLAWHVFLLVFCRRCDANGGQ